MKKIYYIALLGTLTLNRSTHAMLRTAASRATIAGAAIARSSSLGTARAMTRPYVMPKKLLSSIPSQHELAIRMFPAMSAAGLFKYYLYTKLARALAPKSKKLDILRRITDKHFQVDKRLKIDPKEITRAKQLLQIDPSDKELPINIGNLGFGGGYMPMAESIALDFNHIYRWQDRDGHIRHHINQFTLLHEMSHYKQYCDGTIDYISSKTMERDADIQAVQACTCPQCLSETIQRRFYTTGARGYLTSQEILMLTKYSQKEYQPCPYHEENPYEMSCLLKTPKTLILSQSSSVHGFLIGCISCGLLNSLGAQLSPADAAIIMSAATIGTTIKSKL